MAKLEEEFEDVLQEIRLGRSQMTDDSGKAINIPFEPIAVSDLANRSTLYEEQ